MMEGQRILVSQDDISSRISGKFEFNGFHPASLVLFYPHTMEMNRQDLSFAKAALDPGRAGP